MAQHVAAVIGAGSQGKVHLGAYMAVPGVTVAAVADPVGDVASTTAADFGVGRWYTDYREMLDVEQPDLVSVCTPPAAHLEAVQCAIERGARAVHCEKPMATCFGDARLMHELALQVKVQLSFNLQRRFDPVHELGRQQVTSGAIGEVVGLEAYCPNLPDWGAHICDLLLFYMGDEPPAWVMGQVDVQSYHYVYGAPAETTSVTVAQWPSGVLATILTGREPYLDKAGMLVRNGVVVHGTAGRLTASSDRCEVQLSAGHDQTFPSPFNRDPKSWTRNVDPAIVAGTEAAVADMVKCLDEGQEPRLASWRALAGAEMIFATYESSRARRRVVLPLDISDNPLAYGLEHGYWHPRGELRSTY